MNIGLLGGTFDPPHAGHLIAAQDALIALRLDRVRFVPAAVPPHKRGRDISPAALRLRMLEAAISGDERFSVDTIELDRPGPSYTVDTLRALHEREPETRWTLLLGADQYAEFETWRSPQEIRSLARLAVLARTGEGAGASTLMSDPDSPERGSGEGPVPATRTLAGGDVLVLMTRIDISATVVRQRVAAGLPIRYLVPERVSDFISEHRLYRRNGTAVTG